MRNSRLTNPEVRAFVTGILGDQRAKEIEEQDGDDAYASARRKEADEMRGTKDGAPAALTPNGIRKERLWDELWGDFQTAVARILSSDISADDRADLLAQAVAELQQGLNVTDTKAMRVVANTLDVAWEELNDLAGAKALSSRVKDVVTGARSTVEGMLDSNNRLKPAAPYVMQVMLPRTKQADQYPLARLWQSLGLSGGQVAQSLKMQGTKTLGGTRMRLYQLMERGTADDQQRVFAAIKSAALAVGHKDYEVDRLAQLVCPDVVRTGTKDAGGRRNAAASYVDDVLAGGPLPQG